MTQRGKDWCILRASGAATLRLAASLTDAGIEAWSPKRTIRRPAPGQRRALVLGRTRKMHEIDKPILATFVFADAGRLTELAALSVQPFGPHPDFSIFQLGNRVPLLSASSIDGLRAAEEEATAAVQAQRDAETRAAAEVIRIEAMKSDAARRRAFQEAERQRREALAEARRTIAPGTQVVVDEHPAFAGVEVVTVSCVGPHTWVQLGSHTWKIETWRLTPAALHSRQPHTGAAA